MPDILTRNMVREAISWDREENINRRPCDRKELHLESLIAAINSCGVCFKVWQKRNADGGASGTYDFTSLMGSDEKLLLKNLPEKLQGVIIVRKISDQKPMNCSNCDTSIKLYVNVAFSF